MNINRYIMLSALITFAATIHADFTPAQKEFQDAANEHKTELALYQHAMNYWQKELQEETILLKFAAKTQALNNVKQRIQIRAKKIKRSALLLQRSKPWLNIFPRSNVRTITMRDAKLRKLREKKQFLENDIKHTLAEQVLIKTEYLPMAQMWHSVYNDALDKLDLYWLEKNKQTQKTLYNARQDDRIALKKGYLLNKRTLEKQVDLIEINRGIDPISKIIVDKHDVSIAYYEQNNFGTPDKPFNAQELLSTK